MNTLTKMLGDTRMESLLFKIRPELESQTEDIKIVGCRCDKCGEKTTFAWSYKLKGQEDYEEEIVDQHCHKCRDITFTREITAELTGKRKEATRANWLLLTYEDAGFKKFNVIDNITKKARLVSIDYTKKIIAGEKINLLILGNPGTGKTLLGCAIARTLDNEGFVTGFITSVELFKRIKATFGVAGAEEKLFRELKALDVLVIDDVGLEANKQNNGEASWLTTKWAEIVDARRGLATVYTSNVEEADLPKYIGERAVSRMYENSLFFDLYCDDYRKKMKLETL